MRKTAHQIRVFIRTGRTVVLAPVHIDRTYAKMHFVVPPDVYESFNGKQNYHTVGGTIAKKMASELQQVDQYVLNFEFQQEAFSTAQIDPQLLYNEIVAVLNLISNSSNNELYALDVL